MTRRRVLLVCLALVLPLVASASAQRGLHYRWVEVPGSGPGHLLDVDLSVAQVRVLDARDLGEKALTARQFAERTGAAAVVNGPFFDVDGAPLGLLVVDGQQRIKLRPVDWGVLALRTGRASIVHTDQWTEPPDVRGAIQVGPRLVVGGKPLALKKQVARRTVACLKNETSLTLAVLPRPTAATSLARWLAKEGCADALNLDGGPSTQLYFHSGSDEVEELGGVPIPVALGVFVDDADIEVEGRRGCGGRR